MSPEQIASGAEAVDARTDVYAAWASCCWRLACGRVPFGGENTAPHRTAPPHPRRTTHPPGPVRYLPPRRHRDHRRQGPRTRPRPFAQPPPNSPTTCAGSSDKRPIQGATRPSLGYVARSFVRRNRLLAGALGLAVLAMVSALAVVGWAAATSREQARRGWPARPSSGRAWWRRCGKFRGRAACEVDCWTRSSRTWRPRRRRTPATA